MKGTRRSRYDVAIDHGEYEPAGSLPDGTTEAITLLYRREGGAVYRTIYGIVLDAGESRDLTRETFVRAYHAWERFDRSDARVWLLRIAADLAITYERGARRHGGIARWMPSEAVTVDEDGKPAQEAKADLVAWLMRPLTPEQRALVTLCYYQQFTPAQISNHFGIPAGSLASRLNRAMQVLRRRAQAVGGALQPGEYASR